MKFSLAGKCYMTKPNPADWLYFAESDLRLAYKALEEELFHLVCFHAQQTAEKLLKSQFIVHNKPVPKIHSLIELANRLSGIITGIEAFMDDFRSLDRFYLPTRYPDALPGSLAEGLPLKKDAEEALASAQKFLDFLTHSP